MQHLLNIYILYTCPVLKYAVHIYNTIYYSNKHTILYYTILIYYRVSLSSWISVSRRISAPLGSTKNELKRARNKRVMGQNYDLYE